MAFPGLTINHFCLVQTVDRLGQGVVVGVAHAAHRGFDTRLGQALRIADRDILHASVTVMDQPALHGLAGIQRLLQSIQHEVGARRAGYPPADDSPGKDVDDEGDIHKALPGGDVGEIRDPQGVRTTGLELAIDVILRTRHRPVADGGTERLATKHATQPQPAHQPFDRAARHVEAFASQLSPDLAHAVDREVFAPDALNLGTERLIPAQASRPPFRVGLAGGMLVVGRRGNRQYLADRLDPVGLAVVVDEGLHRLKRRSSSAWAKYAEALRRISLACRSSRTSRSSALSRSRSGVVSPSRSPPSRSA